MAARRPPKFTKEETKERLRSILARFLKNCCQHTEAWWYRIIDAHEDVGKGSKHDQPVPPLSELLGMSESLSIEFLKACGVLCKYGKKGELRVRTTNHVDSLEALISKHRLDIEVVQSTHALLGSKVWVVRIGKFPVAQHFNAKEQALKVKCQQRQKKRVRLSCRYMHEYLQSA
jgi:hypothetical protein